MTSAAKLRTGMRMTLDDFLALEETDGKWELDDGVLYIMASGSPDHQFLIMEFSRHILAHVDQFEVPPAELYHEMTTVLSRELQRAPEPDIVIILAQSRGIVGGSRVEGTPLGPGDVLTTPLLPELAIPLLEIFHHRRRPPREG